MASEKRRFGMHHNLLYDVIMRQAGTVQKSILEGVMNAIDAGSTRCDITLDTHSFSISDDGHGFQSRQEIKDFFEVFGTPHEEGDATYGRYRMGRGQMMAFGPNTWRSRTFEMKTDVKNDGLDWDLVEHEEDHLGTRVEVQLYDPIMPSDLERTFTEIRSYVAWAQIPVYLNGSQISKTPETGKWTHEDEYAYYALSSERNQLAIYNLGVLVGHTYAGNYGMGGIVVSKQQLEVNFARNDVQSTCAVGKAIRAFIKKEATKGAAKKTKLTDVERDMLVRGFMAGDANPAEALKLRVITDVFGRSWPINKLSQLLTGFSGRIVVADRGDLLAETAQRRGYAFCIDQATLERFGTSDLDEFKTRVAAAATKLSDGNGRDYMSGHHFKNIAHALNEVVIFERDELSQFVSSDHIPIDKKELTADQQVLLASIQSGYAKMIKALNAAKYEDRDFTPRQIFLGRSDSALGWTDGQTSIWIDAEYARLLRRGHSGATQIAMLLLHETLHEGPDTGTHQHDHEFYQDFHDMSFLPEDPIGLAVNQMIVMLITRMRLSKKKISKALLARDDADLFIDALRKEKMDEAEAETELANVDD